MTTNKVTVALNRTTVSIAMATFNGASYVREQLGSIAKQSRLPDELIVCDDGSTDTTVAIIKDFANSAPFRVAIYENPENLGYGKNFQKAILLCSGDIIFLSDQDDYWLPEKIETQVQHLENHASCMLVICDMEICDSKLTVTGRTKLQDIELRGGHERSFVNGCGMAIRRNLISIALPMSERAYAHDSWLALFAEASGTSDIIRRPLQLHRRHKNNTSRDLGGIWAEAIAMDRFRLARAKYSYNGWAAQLENIKLALGRLKVTDDNASAYQELVPVEQTIDALERRYGLLMRRMSLSRRGRLVRWPFVFAFWVAGAYSELNGWRSAVRDLVSPKIT